MEDPEEPVDEPIDPNAGKHDYKLFSLRRNSVINF